MAKCTGMRCPMQVGYKVDECEFKDCPCRTEPITNADRIRAMSDEEIAEYVCRNSINTLCDIICGGECNAISTLKRSGDWACKEIVMKWLQQPVEEESDG